MKAQINTQIHIQAHPKKVWKILMDFKNYSKWNPFILSISGSQEVNQKLQVRFEEMSFSPTVIDHTPYKKFSWLGKLWFSGIFDGHHSFELAENEDGTTTFFQNEQFNGILIPLFKRKMMDQTRNNFENMNQKLKEIAESSD